MHVYAIESPQGLVKIGKSGNPDQRISTLSSAGGFEPVSVWYSLPVPNAAAIETAAHGALAEFRQMGEWFKAPFDAAVDAVQSLIKPAEPVVVWQTIAKQIMDEKGIRAVDICKKMRLNKAVFSHWINGRHEPSVAQFAELARHLGTTPNDLLSFGTPEMPQTFSARLKQARDKAGLTQAQLASVSGISRVSISQWESESTKAYDAAALLKIARALNVSPYWLMFGDQA